MRFGPHTSHPFSNSQHTFITGLFALQFFTFPVVLGLGNVTTLAILITGLYFLKLSEVRNVWSSHRMIWLLLAFYGIILAGLLYSPAEWAWKSIHLNKYAKAIYAAVMISLLVAFPQAQRAALHGFIAAMLFISASTWLNIWFLLPWSASQALGWGQSHHVIGDYITQNVMMSFFCVIALHFSIQSRRVGQKLFWTVIFFASAITITHLSIGRTGYVALLTALAAYIFTAFESRWKYLALIGMTAIGLLAFGTSPTLQARFGQAWQELLISQENHESSIGHRIFNYKTTAQMVLDKPILGHGTGAYHTEICKFITPVEKCANYSWHPHNQYLFIAADHGIVGAFIFIGIIAYSWWLALKAKDRQTRVLLAALASLLLVNSTINSPLWSARESHFFFYMLALLAAMASTRSAMTSKPA